MFNINKVLENINCLYNIKGFPDDKGVINSKVLVVIWKEDLTVKYGWGNVRNKIKEYVKDIYETSDFKVHYSVDKILSINEFPILTDGKLFDYNTYDLTYKTKKSPYSPLADYDWMLRLINAKLKVDNYADDYLNYDEIWLIGAPFMGFYESRMIGKNPIWVNGPAIETPNKKQIIMGFSSERGIGEMLEDFGHRTESIMNFAEPYLWKNFIKDCGTVHTPPNAFSDYDWGNSNIVISNHKGWFKYPNYVIEPEKVSSSIWGGGDMRLHHMWWLGHLPKNWWSYLVDMSFLDRYQEILPTRNINTKHYYRDSLFEKVK